MTEQRFRQAEGAAWTGIAGNLALAIMKGIVGWSADSKALLADAVNSASDAAGSVAVLAGLKTAKLRADQEPAHRHARMETIAAIIASVLLLVAGLEIGVKGLNALTTGVQHAPASYALIALLISGIVKEALFQYNYRLGKKIAGKGLVAAAWDHRTDVISSLAALAGVGGAIIGDRQGVLWLLYLDPAASLFISLLIIRKGYKLVMDSMLSNTERVLQQEDTTELIETVQRVGGVIAVNELRAREHGHYVIVDVKISVNPKITVLEGHDIGKKVKTQLMKRFSHVSDVFIYVNPYDPGYPYKADSTGEEEFPALLH